MHISVDNLSKCYVVPSDIIFVCKAILYWTTIVILRYTSPYNTMSPVKVDVWIMFSKVQAVCCASKIYIIHHLITNMICVSWTHVFQIDRPLSSEILTSKFYYIFVSYDSVSVSCTDSEWTRSRTKDTGSPRGLTGCVCARRIRKPDCRRL